VPTGRYSDLIERLTPGAAAPGDIVHIDGRVLGRHPGVVHYTVGQRRGLGLGGFGKGEPLFVVKLDAARARVIVGPREALATHRVRLRALNWIGPGTLDDCTKREELYVQIRSSRLPVQARLCIGEGEAAVEFAAAEDAVSPGQACVFYASDRPRARVLGGGFIISAEPDCPADAENNYARVEPLSL
jgi:tRNA-specific 2-thiouridylase